MMQQRYVRRRYVARYLLGSGIANYVSLPVRLADTHVDQLRQQRGGEEFVHYLVSCRDECGGVAGRETKDGYGYGCPAKLCMPPAGRVDGYVLIARDCQMGSATAM